MYKIFDSVFQVTFLLFFFGNLHRGSNWRMTTALIPTIIFSNLDNCHYYRIIRLKYELMLTIQVFERIITLQHEADYRFWFPEQPKTNKGISSNERQVVNHSSEITLWWTLVYTQGLMGNSVPQQSTITANTRHSDMSQAGSQGGCLLSVQRNIDGDRTPPYTIWQPLRHDRRTTGGNTKKEHVSTGDAQIS